MAQISNYPDWRWDRGRLDYFNFNTIKLIAQALLDLESINLNSQSSAVFRAKIETKTGLPYLPATYSVWRNYARVFRYELLAAKVNGRLTLTDVCRALTGTIGETWDVDDYFSFLIPRFYYPSPAFDDYNHRAKQIFPICALIKYLIAKQQQTGNGFVSLEDVFLFLIGNECTGLEPLEFYCQIGKTNYRSTSDQKREMREMLIFYSQCSFFKWTGNIFYLDIEPLDRETLKRIEALALPIQASRASDRDAEIISLASL
jgi:hypothetical protein